jgi:hypothetical protein
MYILPVLRDFLLVALAASAVTNSSRDGIRETRYALIRRLSRKGGGVHGQACRA